MNHWIFPLSTLEKRSSNPHPIFTQTASGYFDNSFFTVLSNRIVLATTPSWEKNLSISFVSIPSVSMISTAFPSWILAFSLFVSFALTASGIRAVSWTSPNCNSIIFIPSIQPDFLTTQCRRNPLLTSYRSSFSPLTSG